MFGLEAAAKRAGLRDMRLLRMHPDPENTPIRDVVAWLRERVTYNPDAFAPQVRPKPTEHDPLWTAAADWKEKMAALSRLRGNLAALEARGFRIAVHGDKLHVTSLLADLDDPERKFFRENKEAILRLYCRRAEVF